METYILGKTGTGKTTFLKYFFCRNYDNYVPINEVIIDYNNCKDVENFINQSINRIIRLDNKNVIAYGIYRTNISKTPSDKGFMTLFDKERSLYNPVEWLQNLDHYNCKSGYYSPVKFTDAIHFLEKILGGGIKIEVNPIGVFFTEKGITLSFDKLSDTHRNIIILVSDIIIRLSETQKDTNKIYDFCGTVIIDLIELYLDADFSLNIINRLRTLLPNVKFILSTNSEEILSTSCKNARFYKTKKDKNSNYKITKIKKKNNQLWQKYTILSGI